ncbi:MAG: ATP-binding protein [Ruminococcus sp.]|jgi:predicted AAA+ superfamily ATPase|nr:ATP-binding protein [Ruminococcus sp.]
MKRLLTDRLVEWKSSKHRKPLILHGARQVGKTWLMKDFGERFYSDTAYIDFNNNARMKSLFEGDFDIPRLIEGLQAECRKKITPGETLLIFDEVQEVPLALTSLKYFYENAPEYHIIAGGSLLGVSLHSGTSFPVGKVDFLDLYPLNFTEFLCGIGEGQLADILKNRDWSLITAFKSKYIDYLRKYYFVGGMPESVTIYTEERDYKAVRTVQNAILLAYDQDFSKHVPKDTIAKVRSVWNNIPRLLARENKRFSPGVIQKGSRLKDYENAIQWLSDAGLIYQVECVSKPGIPLKNYTDGAFKIYAHDVGLLSCMAEIDARTLLEGNSIFTEFKGSLTEQYVCSELKQCGITPYYWSSEHTAEVDFVFKKDRDILPLEVKAEENLKAKSLKLYSEKYNPVTAVRTSMSDYRKDDWLTNVPLYAIGGWLG